MSEATAQTVQTEREQYRRLYRAGRFAECLEIAERVLQTEPPDRLPWVDMYACALYRLGSLREAYSVYLTNSHLLAECPDQYAVGNYYLDAGAVAQDLGPAHRDRALSCYEKAAECYERAGLRSEQGFALNNAACVQIERGYPERAHAHLDEAGRLFDVAGETARRADVEVTRAEAYEAAGDLRAAFDCSQRAVLALEALGEAEAASYEKACETHDRVFRKLRSLSTPKRFDPSDGTPFLTSRP